VPRQHILPILRVPAAVLMLSVAAHASQAPLFGPAVNPQTPARLDVAIRASTAAIVPGRPTVLSLEMRPAPGIHVYAPGNAGYIPVAVTLTVPTGVQVHAAVYPKGEDYVFGELQETVKVYSRAFEVRQQIVVSRDAARAAGASMTIGGSVRYQACDDKVCFPPATAPVTITLPIATRSPTRAPS
jgi:DsbC/DsbD-like thiol-disulfide interchange protein